MQKITVDELKKIVEEKPELAEKLNSLGETVNAEFNEILASYGYELEVPEGELDDDSLDAVAGGGFGVLSLPGGLSRTSAIGIANPGGGTKPGAVSKTDTYMA